MKLLLVGATAILTLAAAGPCDQAQTAKVLWRTPGRTTMEDWKCGPGGCGLRPAPPFHFVKEESGGSTPKMDVRDAKGRVWSVKFGGEAISECFGSRFLPAVGYVAEPTFCIDRARVEGLPRLRKTLRHSRRPDGTFALGRFELRGQKDMEFQSSCTWAWNANPFLGTHELAGLKIVTMLLSNWDAKDSRSTDDSNNGVFRSTLAGKPVLLYSVFDWGASLGSWGGFRTRSQSDCVGFSRDTPRFVRSPGPGTLDWGFSGKNADDLRAGVGVNDVRWLLPYLERIQPDQMQAGLLASGATPRQAGCWTSALQERIRQLRTAAR